MAVTVDVDLVLEKGIKLYQTASSAVINDGSTIPPDCILFIIDLNTNDVLRRFGSLSFDESNSTPAASTRKNETQLALENAQRFVKSYASLVCPAKICRRNIPHGNYFCGYCGTPAVARLADRSRSPQRGAAGTSSANTFTRLEITGGDITLQTYSNRASIQVATGMVEPTPEAREQLFEGTNLTKVNVNARSPRP